MAEAAIKDSNNTIVFLRHGESEWLHKNIYCGWYDSDITREGEREAYKAGQILKENGYIFDEVYTSVLRRSGKTVDILLKVLSQHDIPVFKTWRLNSRHYGALTGLSKSESIRKYGEEQMKLWRRSYDIPPPEITKDNPYYNRILEDPIYKGGPSEDEFPITESLQQAIERTLPYWNDIIAPRVANGRRILIVGHMNSLRAIIKIVDRISDEKIMEYNIPTGIPFIYEFTQDMKPIISLKFLGDEELVRKANETLTIPGRGFERPKRSKPSVLEVYDYLNKKIELLPTVQSIDDKNREDIKEHKPTVAESKIYELETKQFENISQKIDGPEYEKLEVKTDETEPQVVETEKRNIDETINPKVDELVESKVDAMIESKMDDLVEPKVDELLDPEADELIKPKLDDMAKLELDEIVETKVVEGKVFGQPEEKSKENFPELKDTVEKLKKILAQPIDSITKDLTHEENQEFSDDTEIGTLSVNEKFDLKSQDNFHGKKDTSFAIDFKPEKIDKISSKVEKFLDSFHTPDDVISGVISIVHDEPSKIKDKSKSIVISKEHSELHELISKESPVESSKDIKEKLSMVASRIDTRENKSHKDIPTKKEENSTVSL